MHPRRRRPPRWARGRLADTIVLTLVGALLAVGCGSSSTDARANDRSDPERPISAAEAAELSDVLHQLWQSSPRAVELDVEYATSTSIHLQGVVDWKGHLGEAQVTAVGTGGADDGTSMDLGRWSWNGSEIIMPLTSAMAAVAAAEGVDPVPVAVVVPMQSNVPLHLVLQVVSALGQERPENPLLLRDRARFLRSTTLRGEPVRIFTVDQRTQYWLDADGRARRMVAQIKGFAGPATFDLLDEEVEPPVVDTTDVVPVDSLPEPVRSQLISGGG